MKYNRQKHFILLLLSIIPLCSFAYSQTFQGQIVDKDNNTPIQYVNIGIPLKNIGTVSNINGFYTLSIPNGYENDSVLFSCIGFTSLKIGVKDLNNNSIIQLERTFYEIDDILIQPTKTTTKLLGVKTNRQNHRIVFNNQLLGSECGLLIKNKRQAILKELNVSIATCSSDSVFFGLNVYEKGGKNDFENILKTPIYIKVKAKSRGLINIDLSKYNIQTNDDFLITLQYIDNANKNLSFCYGPQKKTYYRDTSHATWKTMSGGVGFTVKVEMER